jgi:serine-type D-Ala-D-Ala carboxypeptidase (penicillin-binding protein 5/6)
MRCGRVVGHGSPRVPANYDDGVPLTQRQIFARRRVAVFGGGSVFLAIAFYLPLTLLAPLTPAVATVLPYAAPAQAAPQLDWPHYGASAIGAVGYEGVLSSSGKKSSVPIASITKLVTSLVVLEKKPLAPGKSGPQITFTNADVQFYKTYVAMNGKVAPVRSGLTLSELQVLQVTLIDSANNYAKSLVTWAFGSEAAFLPVANAWLKAHQLAHTHLADVAGILPSSTSTAADLIELGKLVLAQPLLSSIVSTKELNIQSVGVISNTNTLLGKHGIVGIKTGTLGEAGACLLFASSFTVGKTAITVIGVILGGVDHKSLDKDVVALLASAKESFRMVTLSTKGAEFASVSTAWGGKVAIVAAETRSVVVWANTPISLLVQTSTVTLAKAGTSVGSLNFSVGGVVQSVPLKLSHSIEDPGPLWRLSNPGNLF